MDPEVHERYHLQALCAEDEIMAEVAEELAQKGLRLATTQERGSYTRVRQLDNAQWVTDIDL